MIRSRRSAALLAYIAEYSDEMRPSDRVTPFLVLYSAVATLLDRFGRLQRVLPTLVLDGVVRNECVGAPLDFAGALHLSA